MGTVWVFQHVEAEPPGRLAGGLEGAGHTLRIFRSDLGQQPPRIGANCDALIVMGGPMGVYDHADHPWINPELDLIRMALDAGLPTLGLCLGSQLVAAAAGARVYPGEAPPEIGWTRVGLTPAGAADPLCGPLADAPGAAEATVFEWHGDAFDLPAGAELLAGNGPYPRQAFRLGAAYGFLFHFELTRETIAAWLALWPEEVTAAGQDPQAVLEETARELPSLERRSAALMGAFGARIAAAPKTVPA